MIKFTEGAMHLLKATLVAAKADPDTGFRLLPTPGGNFALAIDTERTGELVVVDEGFKVLLVSIEHLTLLSGTTIDCDYSRDEPVLLVR